MCLPVKSSNMYRVVFVYIYLVLHNSISAYDLCDADEDLCPTEIQPNGLDCKIKSGVFSERECRQINFSSNDREESHLGEFHLKTYVDQYSQINLNISINELKFKKAYLRFTEHEESEDKAVSCKMYTTGSDIPLPVKETLHDTCFKTNLSEGHNYLMEYKAEDGKDVLYKKFLLKVPIKQYFVDTVSLKKRQIFAYVDITSSYKLMVKIQPLPKFYNVTHYQVEVFREKDSKIINTDVRLIVASQEEMTFEHITYNDEGYYYFKISAISEICPEDICEKTVTPKMYVYRRGTPLVIGIVGASCIIPFVLFLFHMFNKMYKTNDDISESNDKMLLIYKQGTDKENEVVRALVKTVENLTGIEVWLDPVNLTKMKQKDPEKWCSDNLLLATHIVYMCSSEAFELDFMTYTFLQEETKKTIPDKDIFVVIMPYSSKKDLPDFLNNCVTFNFLEEFSKFIGVFKSNVTYEHDCSYLDFVKKVNAAFSESEDLNHKLSLPTIVITEQSDGSDSEPKEKDVLL